MDLTVQRLADESDINKLMTKLSFGMDRAQACSHLGITSIYLQGIDTREIVDTVHHRRPPVIPASAGLRP